MNEALSYHIAEGTKLKKNKAKLESDNDTLQGEKEMNEMMIHEKVSQSKHHKQHIKEVSKGPSKNINIFRIAQNIVAGRDVIDMEWIDSPLN